MPVHSPSWFLTIARLVPGVALSLTLVSWLPVGAQEPDPKQAAPKAAPAKAGPEEAPPAVDPLPSWNEGPSRQAIIEFVTKITSNTAERVVPPEQRIAVFDNDGTLWSEQPMYVQLAFILDRVHELAPQHPEWKDQQPFKAVLEKDHKMLAEAGEKGAMELLVATHTGMNTEDFTVTVTNWLARSKHPKYHKPYTECVYLPMQELLAYLRANGFKTYICSGGTQEFMRPWTEKVYGIPPEQVIGSMLKLKYETRGARKGLWLMPDVDLVNDHAGKPVGIEKLIGRRPIAAFGNSDGDLEMLEWTTSAGPGPRFGMIVHHTDAEREAAYDRQSHFGRLDKALDAAQANKWTVVDMKKEWKKVFAFEK